MKNFFIGFSLTFFVLTILVGIPTGLAILAEYLGYDKILWVIAWIWFLACIVVWLISTIDDDTPDWE